MPPTLELHDVDELIESLHTQVEELSLPEPAEGAQTVSLLFCTYTQCLTTECG
ncbi:hypothetical protein ABZX75_28820 [Streptomyces sp. NPDC003038]|uniref:hypothetical protein n=1 Tax=unclassified Streptomyces TaxID=2593676 RepID=UPI0033B46969